MVRTIEETSGDASLPIKVTVRDLAKRLRVASTLTAAARLTAAIDFGAVEQDDAMTGRGGPRYFRVVKTEKAIRADPGLGVFPPVEKVRESLFGGRGVRRSPNSSNKRARAAARGSGYERQ